MTTRLTDEVLANVHGDMQRGVELLPIENQLIAAVMNLMDKVTTDGYDADAAAAGLFAYAAALSSMRFGTCEDARLADIARELVSYIARMATLTGQALHAETHAVAEAPEPVRATVTVERVHAALAMTARWPLDRREALPAAIAGAVASPYQLEALRQFRTVRGQPGLLNVITLTAAEVNQAVQWWNHRAAMLNLENPR